MRNCRGIRAWTLGLGMALIAAMALGCQGADNPGGTDVSTTETASSSDTDTGPVDERQAWREASLFANGSFENVLPEDGSPIGWKCACFGEAEGMVPACTTATDGPAHGKRALVLPPSCAAYQDAPGFDATKGVKYDLFVRGEGFFPELVYLVAYDADDFMQSMTGSAVSGNAGELQNVTTGVLSTRGAVRLRMIFYNGTASDLEVDDFVAFQEGPNPPPVTGALLRAEHYTGFEYIEGEEAAAIWVPLPLDHGTQVPLYMELTADPSSVVDSVEYVLEPEDNWGAVIHLSEKAASKQVDILWQGVVLTREVTSEERPFWYAKLGDTDPWLAATPVVDAGYPGIAQTAASLASLSDSPLERMKAVIEWTSMNLGEEWEYTGLDATTVFETRSGSCTGYANVAAALGRALEVPTRTVANYLVGMSQQTHYIDEFWLGEELGWRRVEPQSTSVVIPERYAVIVRLIQPQDEGPEAMQSDDGAMPGVPLRSLVNILSGEERLLCSLDDPHFADCAICDNRADLQAELLEGEGIAIDDVFQRARAAWQADLEAYRQGGLTGERMSVRRKALLAASYADIDALLDELEAH